MDPSWSERDRSDGPPQGLCATAVVFGTSRPRPPLWSSDQPGRDEGTALLVEPLGPIVGARGLGFGADVARPKGAASLPPLVAAINRADVGNDALDGDTVAGNSGERAFEKRHRAFLALVAPNLTIG